MYAGGQDPHSFSVLFDTLPTAEQHTLESTGLQISSKVALLTPCPNNSVSGTGRPAKPQHEINRNTFVHSLFPPLMCERLYEL